MGLSRILPYGILIAFWGCQQTDPAYPEPPIEAGSEFQYFTTDGQGADDTLFADYWIRVGETNRINNRFTFHYVEHFHDTTFPEKSVSLDLEAGKMIDEDLSDYFLMNGINDFPQGFLTHGAGAIKFSDGLPDEDSTRVGINPFWVSNGILYDSVRIFVKPPSPNLPNGGTHSGTCFVFTKRNKLLETWTYRPGDHMDGWIYRGKAPQI